MTVAIQCSKGHDLETPGRCRACDRENQRRRYAANPQKDRERRRRLRAANPDLDRVRHRQWRIANPQKRAAARRRYRLAHLDVLAEKERRFRARKHGVKVGSFTAAQVAARMAYFGNRCVYCSGPFEEVDHYKPTSRGGPHMLVNLRPSCTRCNALKRDSWPITDRLLARMNTLIL